MAAEKAVKTMQTKKVKGLSWKQVNRFPGINLTM